MRPGQSELNLELAKSFNPDVKGDNLFASIDAGYNTDKFQFGGGFEQTEQEFNVDKIGYRPHDANVGEKELFCYGGYNSYLPKRFGHHWIDFWHEDWYFRWKQQGYRGDTFGLWYVLAGKPFFDDTHVRFWTGEQYDWEEKFFLSFLVDSKRLVEILPWKCYNKMTAASL